MNALLIYPKFPDTYWSFKHALSFLGKRAAQPPLGLMTVAALLPNCWSKRLVDENIERLRDRDLKWADVALISAMHIQKDALFAILARCRSLGLRTVVGGPIASSLPWEEINADHLVIGEAESLITTLAGDLEQDAGKPVYQALERPGLETSPLPDVSLIKMNRYSTMAVQYSRGCPFNCEFCDIIEIYGRRPRTKTVQQVIAELDQLRAAGWRESVFIVDDNFIGNKARAKELCAALARWRSQHKVGFDTDKEDIFDRMTEFIQKSGIPVAMVGLLQAMPGTQLFRRLWREGRIVHTDAGDNTSMSLNFLPRMDPTKLVEGYRSVLKQIYSSDAYYKRVKLYLKRTEAAPGEKRIKQRWMTRANARALVTSIIRQGVFGRQRWSYWKFLATAATRYRHSFGAAMTLVVMGYHFQVMTRRLSKFKLPAFPTTVNEKDLPAETGGQV